MAAARAGSPLATSMLHLTQPPIGPVSLVPGDTSVLLSLLADRARRFSESLEAKFSKARQSGSTFDQALNSVAMRAYKCSEVHCMFTFARIFRNAIPEYVEQPEATAAVEKLCELAMLKIVHEHAGDWVGCLSSEQLEQVSDRIEQLLLQLRPDAVGLTDALGFTDWDLESTLGLYNGNCYEALYNAAKLNPLNSADVMVGWQHLAPQLDLEFLKDGASTQRSTMASKL